MRGGLQVDKSKNEYGGWCFHVLEVKAKCDRQLRSKSSFSNGAWRAGRDHAHQHESGASVQSHMTLADDASKDVCGGRDKRGRERERREKRGRERKPLLKGLETYDESS